MTDKGLVSKMYEQLIQLNIKITNSILKNGQKNQIDIFLPGSSLGGSREIRRGDGFRDQDTIALIKY